MKKVLHASWPPPALQPHVWLRCWPRAAVSGHWKKRLVSVGLGCHSSRLPNPPPEPQWLPPETSSRSTTRSCSTAAANTEVSQPHPPPARREFVAWANQWLALNQLVATQSQCLWPWSKGVRWRTYCTKETVLCLRKIRILHRSEQTHSIFQIEVIVSILLFFSRHGVVPKEKGGELRGEAGWRKFLLVYWGTFWPIQFYDQSIDSLQVLSGYSAQCTLLASSQLKLRSVKTNYIWAAQKVIEEQ